MNHVDDDTRLNYVADRLSDPERLEVDEHLADCDSCRRKVTDLYALRASFAEIWLSWNATTHGHLARRHHLMRALRRANGHLADVVGSWLVKLSEEGAMAVKVWVDKGRQLAVLAELLLPQGVEFELRPAIAGVGSAGDDAEIDALLTTSSQYLAEDRPDEAERQMVEVARLNAFAARTANSVLYYRGQKLAELWVDSVRGTLYVKYWTGSAFPAADMVLLVPDSDTDVPRTARLEAVPDEDYRLAAFEGSVDGRYEILFGTS